MLIGVSGAGKTTLSRFVAWINGLSVFQIKVRVHRVVTYLWSFVLQCWVNEYVSEIVSGKKGRSLELVGGWVGGRG